MRLILAYICFITMVIAGWSQPPKPMEFLSLGFSALFFMLDQIRSDFRDRS